jgi:hypothetical protein
MYWRLEKKPIYFKSFDGVLWRPRLISETGYRARERPVNCAAVIEVCNPARSDQWRRKNEQRENRSGGRVRKCALGRSNRSSRSQRSFHRSTRHRSSAAAKKYSEAGFAALVTKDHDYAGVATAQLIRSHFPDLKTKVYSSIVLNNVVGGLESLRRGTYRRHGRQGGLDSENHLQWEMTAAWSASGKHAKNARR